MQPDQRHDKRFGRQNAILGEAEDETFEHFITDRQTRLPQNRPQVVAARLARLAAVVFAESDLRVKAKITIFEYPRRCNGQRISYTCTYIYIILILQHEI